MPRAGWVRSTPRGSRERTTRTSTTPTATPTSPSTSTCGAAWVRSTSRWSEVSLVRLAGSGSPQDPHGPPQAHQRPSPFEEYEAKMHLDHDGEHDGADKVGDLSLRETRGIGPAKLAGREGQ